MATVMRFAVPIAAFLLVALPSRGLAGKIEVPPGVGTLQAAIDAASPGDVLQLEADNYFGPVVVNKAVRVRGRLGTSIVADCSDPVGLDIAADEVEIRDLVVRRFAITGIRIAGRSRVTLKGVAASSTAFPLPGCPSPTGFYIDLDAVTRVRLQGAGGGSVRVADLEPNARVRIDKGILGPVLVANVQAPRAFELSRSQVTARGSGQTLIMLQNADGVRVWRNIIAWGQTGIAVDADSDDNRFLKNWFRSAEGTDIVDDGTGNCWKDNVEQAAPGGMLTGNPSTAGCP